jgi:uncharacterized protein (TIGR01319 family)
MASQQRSGGELEVRVCVDLGSTFTKAAAVRLPDGRLLGTAQSRTTIDTDVAEGLDEVLASLATHRSARPAASWYDDVVACSSAGGGLRLAVVGYERSVTAEAGHRVGLSAGARVEHVSSGPLDDAHLAALVGSRPDVVLLVGGTDGGNADVLMHNARALAHARLDVPVVVAGNAAAADQVRRILRHAGQPVTVTANVLPRIGVLEPRPAREAIREVFIRHVIGGKHLSARLDLSRLVRAATPDAVLAGVEVLADEVGDVILVDVGGATTDVYSVLSPDPEALPAEQDAAGTLWRSRTVEGDLGVRWNAAGIVEAARGERLVDDVEAQRLGAAAVRLAAHPGLVPTTPDEREVDGRLAMLAATVALRRHARPHESGGVRHPGKDLRRVALVVGSGGVFRHAGPQGTALLRACVHDLAGGWRLPERAEVVVDRHYVMAAAGTLDPDQRAAATALVRTLLPTG